MDRHCVLLRCVFAFSPPFFFFFHAFSLQAAIVHVRYINSSSNFWLVFREQCIRALFTDPQISFFINFFIKNGSYSTIYTFKNYFAIVISAINFQFQQNKSYPNRPLMFSLYQFVAVFLCCCSVQLCIWTLLSSYFSWLNENWSIYKNKVHTIARCQKIIWR